MADEIKMEDLVRRDLAEQKEQNATLKQGLEELKAIVATGLKVESNAVKPPVIPTEPFDHKGEKLKWKAAAFKKPGSQESITALEASTEPDLIDEILGTEGQGILVVVH